MGLTNFGKLMCKYNASSIPTPLFRQAKQLGYSDRQLAEFWGSNEVAVRRLRVEEGIMPVGKQIDTGRLLGKPPARSYIDLI